MMMMMICDTNSVSDTQVSKYYLVEYLIQRSLFFQDLYILKNGHSNKLHFDMNFWTVKNPGIFIVSPSFSHTHTHTYTLFFITWELSFLKHSRITTIPRNRNIFFYFNFNLSSNFFFYFCTDFHYSHMWMKKKKNSV